jgi:predicted permease
MVVDSARNNSPLLIRDNYNLRPDTLTGRFQLRVLHLSPNAPGVNIGLVGDTSTTYIIADTLTFLKNLSQEQINTQARFRTFRLSATNPTLADTTLNLVIRAGGVVLPDTLRLPVQEKSVYTVIARGFVGGTGAQAFQTRIIKDR